ncbi:MAG: hypothetical protein K6G10_06730 [Butyrivibrio sp.]|nr:hypothetical protein [Butyrivibrio sp.]
MEILTNALDYIKSNWKNISLCVLIPAVLGLSIALAISSGNNHTLKNTLSEKEAAEQAYVDDLAKAQKELEDLKAEYSTMASKVDNEALAGALDGDAKAIRDENGEIIYVDDKGEPIKNEDGTPFTYKDLLKLINENGQLKADNKTLTESNETLTKKVSATGNNNSNNTSSTNDLNTITALSNENEKLQNQVNNLTGKVNGLQASNDALSELNKTLSSELDKSVSQETDIANASLKVAQDYEKRNSAMVDENAKLSAEFAQVSADLNAYKSELVDTIEDLTDANLNVSTLTGSVNALTSSLEDTQAQLEAVTQAYNQLDGSIDSATIIEAYREAVENIAGNIADIDAQIEDINKKTEWSDLDLAACDTLQARIDAGDESLASIADMEAELRSMEEAHTLTSAETEAIAELEAQKARLEGELETARSDLETAEAEWLAGDPSDSVDNLLTMDAALREKIDELEAEIAVKESELATATSEADTLEAEMYRLRESISELEAQYNAISLDMKLTGSYENHDGSINFGLSGGEEYNALVSSIESMISSLKERANALSESISGLGDTIKTGLEQAGDVHVDDDPSGNGKIYSSKYIHRRVNIVFFEGTNDQITVKGTMPYGQITKTSGTGTDVTTYIDTSTGSWSH